MAGLHELMVLLLELLPDALLLPDLVLDLDHLHLEHMPLALAVNELLQLRVLDLEPLDLDPVGLDLLLHDRHRGYLVVLVVEVRHQTALDLLDQRVHPAHALCSYEG